MTCFPVNMDARRSRADSTVRSRLCTSLKFLDSGLARPTSLHGGVFLMSAFGKAGVRRECDAERAYTLDAMMSSGRQRSSTDEICKIYLWVVLDVRGRINV